MTTSPWSVKGIDPEAREAAKIAARRARITVGQWLNQTIRAAASEQLRNGGRPAPEAPRNGGFTSSTGGEAGVGHGHHAPEHTAHPPAPTMQAIFESIQKLSSRVEAAEIKTTAAIAPLAEQVDSLTRQIDEVKQHGEVSTAPVERAVTRLSERLQKIEEGSGRTRRDGRWSLFGFSR
jgi:localization factor PodJL